MQRWSAIGEFIGSHMWAVSPLCVAAGVLFPREVGVLNPLVVALFAFMTFQGSLSNRFSNLAQTARHPLPMFVILGLSAVVMPAFSCVLAQLLFGSDGNLVTGIVLEYCVTVAVVSTMWIGMSSGNMALGLGTLLVSTVVSPVTIPLTLKLLLGETVRVDFAGMMFDMLVEIAIPALAGVAINDLTHGWGKRTLSPALMPAARITIMLVIASNSTGISAYMRNLTPTLVMVALFICAYASLGYLVGFVVARLLGERREDVVTSTFQVGMRNISAGAVLAQQFFPAEVMFPVVAGTLFQQILAAICEIVVSRVLGTGEVPSALADEKAAPDEVAVAARTR